MSRSPVVATAAAVLACAAAVPAVADAHVTLQPDTAPAGAFTLEAVRVPNEQDAAVTTKVDVQLPHGFASASYEAVPGWSAKITKSKLAKPIQTDDGPIDEEVSRITFTAESRADGIQPGQFRDFPLSVQIPGKPGDQLTFKALQTYSNGQVVRWIGPPDADTPAPRITVTKAAGAAAPAAAATTTVVKQGGDGASKGLGVAALIVGVIGCALGAGALMARRRP
ncbi:MAG TPA: YcnI family protein [Baekduia sp.]|uniref:YcnI family protein n=1 Tax=Baekduia sp. TaxID=2600305 RepID=UPI002D7900F9|nr:YcnI family protein [Baekduia sp.]HET6510294.1 YcnI family protein [Baekduia sp.]